MSINHTQDEIIEEFALFDDWMQKYEHLIEFGKELDPMPDSHKLEENRIHGCQSRVWLTAALEEDNLVFQADSDAAISKGIIGLLLRILSGHKPADIAQADLYALDKIGLKEHLSPNRANGLSNMVKKIRIYALAHSAENA